MSEPNAVSDRVLACEADELADGESMTVEPDSGEAIAVYRVDGQFYATADMCTHEEWSLGEEGELCGFEVTCTLHNAKFDIRDGTALCFPATVALRRYPTTVEAGKVYVLTEESAGES